MKELAPLELDARFAPTYNIVHRILLGHPQQVKSSLSISLLTLAIESLIVQSPLTHQQFFSQRTSLHISSQIFSRTSGPRPDTPYHQISTFSSMYWQLEAMVVILHRVLLSITESSPVSAAMTLCFASPMLAVAFHPAMHIAVGARQM